MIVIDGDVSNRPAPHLFPTSADMTLSQYRKAPEFPYPAAPQDVEDVVQWVIAQKDERTHKLDLQKLSIGGFSAGGGLTLALAARLGKRAGQGKNPICAYVGLYPPTTMQLTGGKMKTPPNPPTEAQLRSKKLNGVVLTKEIVELFNGSYILPAVAQDDPDMSPLLYDAACFPDVTYIACGDGDILYGDGFDLVQKIKKQGRKEQVAEHHSIAGALHAFDKGRFITDERSAEMRRESYDFLFEGIRKGHAHVGKHA